jgi:hypothetical protein
MRRLRTLILTAGLLVRPASASEETLSTEDLARFADLALACVHKEYPNKIAHVMDSDADAKPPRALTPAFYGCYDWHSAVHAHWLLARLTRLHPEAAFVPRARAALATSLTVDNIAKEAAYLGAKGRETFERPYGLAWLLALAQELHEWDDRQAREFSAALEPLTRAGRLPARELAAQARLPHPRGGAQSDRLRLRADPRLGEGDGRSRHGGAHRLAQPIVVSRGPQLSDRLRAGGSGFPLAVSRRGGSDAPGVGQVGFRFVAQGLPPRHPSRRIARLASGRRRDGPHRREAGPSGRAEPEPGVHARRHRKRAAGQRSAAPRSARRGGASPRSRSVRARRSPLRRRALARNVRDVPRDRARLSALR